MGSPLAKTACQVVTWHIAGSCEPPLWTNRTEHEVSGNSGTSISVSALREGTYDNTPFALPHCDVIPSRLKKLWQKCPRSPETRSFSTLWRQKRRLLDHCRGRLPRPNVKSSVAERLTFEQYSEVFHGGNGPFEAFIGSYYCSSEHV